MTDLLPVDDAINRIVTPLRPLPPEDVPLLDARGRVLSQEITADINLPPFDQSAMDGFAIRAADSQHASADNPAQLRVTMDIPAGVQSSVTLKAGEAARIMTGAPIPAGADAVIAVEDTDADFSQPNKALPETVALMRAVQTGAAIRYAGENIRRGQRIFSGGTIIRAAEIGMLASLGHANVPVVRRPKVVIIGSGDELVAIDAALRPGQIRDSNSYALAALVADDGGTALRLPPAPDDPDALRALFQQALAEKPDMIISSAGVSVGAADYVRDILEEFGEIGFWRINLRPGKPLAYGYIEETPFFGLPGNPVSAMVTYMVLVRPALMRLSGRTLRGATITARTGEAMTSDGRRTYARVRLAQDAHGWVAYATGTQSSGAHLSMVTADGLMIIPEGMRTVEIGTELAVQLLKPITGESDVS